MFISINLLLRVIVLFILLNSKFVLVVLYVLLEVFIFEKHNFLNYINNGENHHQAGMIKPKSTLLFLCLKFPT